ncbi:MAG: gliding motility-associated C-terminal domain-containing protein, partial [Bacteroidales bacterium]|nr:gliding motility-associated C-terminal domain-containing protein [Bacteroidales bacterium]
VQVGDTLRITTCKNSIGLITPRTSGGDAPLVYAWEGIEPLTAAEVEDAGLSPLPDSVFAFYFDGSVAEFGCTITERGGEGLSVQMRAYVAYYQTQHVVLEAMPNMRHNRYYENQVVFFTPHPSRFDLYNYYSYTVAEDGGIDQLIDKRQTDNYLYKTDFDFEQGAERRVYVAVADRNGCRSYDSVDLTVLQLPNAMVCNDPNYPEACILFPEFQVEIHDSWGRLVKAIDDGLGWDARRGGKLVDGGTYYYTVKLPTNDGFTYVKGAVTVFNKKK